MKFENPSFLIWNNSGFKKYGGNDCGYRDFYNYWKEQLFERVMRLFRWNGLPDTIPAHEIEQRMIEQGYCAITNIADRGPHAVYSNWSAIGDYFDEFTEMSWFSPHNSGTIKIGDTGILLKNNSIMQPILPLINEYAILLAHNDVTLWSCLVEQREVHGMPVGMTSKDMDSIKKYRNDLINGKIATMQDKTMIGINWIQSGTSSLDCRQFIDIRQELIKAFYDDIGVKSVRNKRAEMSESEVDANEHMLLLNLDDMKHERQESAKKLSEWLGRTVTVEVVEPLIYKNMEVQSNE